MATINESFFVDALSDELSDEVAETLTADSLEELPKSHETNRSQATNILDVTAEAVLSEGTTATEQTAERPQEQSAPPQATLIFVIGEHRFSDSCELGVLNEHPEALTTITPNQCLKAFSPPPCTRQWLSCDRQ